MNPTLDIFEIPLLGLVGGEPVVLEGLHHLLEAEVGEEEDAHVPGVLLGQQALQEAVPSHQQLVRCVALPTFRDYGTVLKGARVLEKLNPK